MIQVYGSNAHNKARHVAALDSQQVAQVHSGRKRRGLRGTTYTAFRLPLSKALCGRVPHD